MYFEDAFCCHGLFFGCMSDVFSAFKIKHIGFKQWIVHFADLKNDGGAGTSVGAKGVFKIKTMRLVVSY